MPRGGKRTTSWKAGQLEAQSADAGRVTFTREFSGSAKESDERSIICFDELSSPTKSRLSLSLLIITKRSGPRAGPSRTKGVLEFANIIATVMPQSE
jgi:hypothetical protein